MAATRQLDLVSLMARLRVDNRWERLLVPAFVYFFAQLYPFRRVNRPTRRCAAAAGGCILIRRESLTVAGGLAAIRGAVIDDVSLARVVKRAGARIWLGLSDGVESVRSYDGLADLWNMIGRNAFAQLRYSSGLLFLTIVGLMAIYVLPIVTTAWGLAVGPVWLAVAGLAAWLVMAATYAPMLAYYRQPVVRSLLLPTVASLYALITIDSARRHRFGSGFHWKGRVGIQRLPRSSPGNTSTPSLSRPQ
jgi:hopene-associated glycosyltransferase HpnB